MWTLNWSVSQPKERGCSLVWWYSSGYFCILSQMTVWEQTVTGWVLSFCILWALCRHLTSLISVMLSRWNSVVLGGFKSLSVQPSCPGLRMNHDVCIQDAFYCFPVKVYKDLAPEFNLLKFSRAFSVFFFYSTVHLLQISSTYVDKVWAFASFFSKIKISSLLSLILDFAAKSGNINGKDFFLSTVFKTMLSFLLW